VREGRIDFDRGQVAARESEFLRMRETFRIKTLPPSRKIPATDANSDLRHGACLSSEHDEDTPRSRS
jgi:hypothetical protein